MKREPKDFLTFDDPGASDAEPANGITVGDIRAWYDQYDRIVLSWADCRERLREETNTVSRVWEALRISTFAEANGKTVWELVAELRPRLAMKLLEIHSALDDALGDSDISHIESDEELREQYPVQWAAQNITKMIESFND